MITAFNWRIAVIVPAQDEEASVTRCIHSIRAAYQHLATPAHLWIVVVADACTDETVSRARAALQNAGEVISCNARSAGAARTIGAAAALKHFSAIPTDQIWLANTDADTHVPPNWLQHQLRFADSGDLAVAGIVELEVINNEELLVHRMFRDTYQVAPDGTHTHVHGANLGVRADAYLAVGGWGTIPLAEDHCLWDRLQRAGFRLRSTDLSRVTTSARLQGRAPGGFADTLQRHVANVLG